MTGMTMGAGVGLRMVGPQLERSTGRDPTCAPDRHPDRGPRLQGAAMNVDGAQRWRSGRASYRPAGEVIDTRRFEVAAVDGPGADNVARAFVVAHHYSASYPAARERIGLYRGGAGGRRRLQPPRAGQGARLPAVPEGRSRTGDAVDLAAWLPGALRQVTRTLKHTGNLRYIFGLTPTMKRLVASSTSYPPQPYPQISVPRPRP